MRGGVEFGFSSTTTQREQAIHYADGAASTIFEMQMGLVDRGADLSWLSQYPHEKEVLFPPLTGLEVLEAGVQGRTLTLQARLSLNLTALTLEQVGKAPLPNISQARCPFLQLASLPPHAGHSSYQSPFFAGCLEKTQDADGYGGWDEVGG